MSTPTDTPESDAASFDTNYTLPTGESFFGKCVEAEKSKDLERQRDAALAKVADLEHAKMVWETGAKAAIRDLDAALAREEALAKALMIALRQWNARYGDLNPDDKSLDEEEHLEGRLFRNADEALAAHRAAKEGM